MKHFLFTTIYPILIITQVILLCTLAFVLQCFFSPSYFPPTLSFLFVLSLSFFAFKAQKYRSYPQLFFLIIYLLTSIYLSLATHHQQPTFNQYLGLLLCTTLYLFTIFLVFYLQQQKSQHLPIQTSIPPDQSP